MRHFFCFVFILTHYIGFGQVIDDFSDGDFTSNPTWSGTEADYIVNGSFELQLSNSVAATSYLTTPHGLATLDNKEWNGIIRQTFSPSGSNFGRFYLTAASTDLTTDPDGFYLQLGEAGSLDAVRLFKVVGGTNTELLAGPSSQIASSFAIGVRVVRDNLGNWSLYIDDTGGTNYTLAGTVNDATALLGTHTGFMETYTLSNADNFFYDDIYIGDEIVDLAPPVLVSATAINANLIDVQFDEAVDPVTAEDLNNYDIQPFQSATSATVDGVNPALVHIVLASALTNGLGYTIFTENIEDLAGNISGSQSADFSFLIGEVPSVGDVVINEFLCDPSPAVGLRDAEFVEIYNKSTKIFNVQDWKIGDASSDGTIQQDWLLPGDHMVLTSTSNLDSFVVATQVTSFPSLNNSGDNIVLRTDLGLVLDSITYTDEWYGDENKEDGGYTIERINPDDPCSDFSDWSASNDLLGGTPGLQNSIYDNTPDTDTPGFDQLIALAPNFLEVYFNEGMDSASLANSQVLVAPILTIQNTYVQEAHPTMMILEFAPNFQASQTYSIIIQNAADCWLNATDLIGQFALPENASEGDVAINEIMFNPITGGTDWVEVYNTSNKLIDLYQWELANYDDDTISNNKIIGEHFLLYPDSYAVISEDSSQIIQQFSQAVLGTFVQSVLPTYSNDSGTIYLISNNTLIDYVSYDADWHFALLDDDDGKTLERLDPLADANSSSNWHTAAEALSFGTPGRLNSQYRPELINGEFSYSSESISPDNDGFEDVLQVNYQMMEPGMVGTFTVYDDRGRLIAQVISSELLALEGTFTWQGITDAGNKASIGTYVGVFEAFSADGEASFVKRKAFVVAGQF